LTDRPPRIGVVGIPGAWSSETLADAVEERTGYRLLVDMSRVHVTTNTCRVMYGDVDLCSLDALWIKKIGETYSPHLLDRLELLRFVAGAGVRSLSDPDRILRLLDRLSCTVTLAQAGIPMPETIVTEDVDLAVDAIERFGQAVLKPLYSTKARGMQLLDRERTADLAGAVEAFRSAGNPVIYIQKKIDLPENDLGLIFLGGEYLGAYARVRGADSWNTTIHHGGRYEACDPAPESIEIAHRAQEAFGLDFTCVDVVELEDSPVVFEVSAFGGFRGMFEARGVQLANTLVDYTLDMLS